MGIKSVKEIEAVTECGKKVGAVLRDSVGYFYRKCVSGRVSVSARNNNDGCYCTSLAAVYQVMRHGSTPDPLTGKYRSQAQAGR